MLYTRIAQPVRGLVISPKAWTSDFAEFCTEKLLSCEVVFGSPRMDCRGTGICKLVGYSAVEADTPRSCRHNKAFLMPTRDGQCLALVFRQELLCARILRTQFRNEQLTLKESFRIPPIFIESLGLKKKFLKAGSYALEQFNGHFLIKFHCT